MVKISKRLEMIAEHIQPNSLFADIGSDHAYLPAYVCSHNDNIRAIAGEVQKGPYEAAIRTVNKHQLGQQVEVRLGNGLEVIRLEDQVDTIVIAGMGGKLIRDIMANGLEKLKDVRRFILQPNTNAELVRQFLLQQHIPLEHEAILEENGHIYEVLFAERQSNTWLYSEAIDINKQLFFGPLLMQEKPLAFQKKWRLEYSHTLSIIEQLKTANQEETSAMKELQTKKRWMEEVIQ